MREPDTTSIRIEVNGDLRVIRSGITLSSLLQQMELNPRFLAVERNRELVPRAQHPSCVLEEGDSLEIVTLVGGG